MEIPLENLAEFWYMWESNSENHFHGRQSLPYPQKARKRTHYTIVAGSD